jgi:hypothetical protein
MLTLALLFAQAVTPVVKPAPPLRHTLAGEKPHIVMPKKLVVKCPAGSVQAVMGPSCVADPLYRWVPPVKAGKPQ